MQPRRFDTNASLLEYLFARLRRKHADASSRPPFRRNVRFEPLEPRLLLSADPVIPLAADLLAANQTQQEDQAGILGQQDASPAIILSNAKPFVDAGPDRTADEGALVLLTDTGRLSPFTVTFRDADTLDTHTVSIDWDDGDSSGGDASRLDGEEVGKVGVDLHGNVMEFARHVYDDAGVYTVMITVTDNHGESGFDAFEITVFPVNDAPILGEISDQIVREGDLLSFTATATDADLPPNALTFSLIDAPEGAMIDGTTGLFNWTPAEAQGPAITSLTVRVTDDGDSSLFDEQLVSITVIEVNSPPVLEAIADKDVREGELLTFTVAASDLDLPANALFFSLDPGAPAGAGIDPTTGAFSWAPSEAQAPGDYEVTVRVTDDGVPSLDDSETFKITVNEASQPPVVPIAYWSLNETSGRTLNDTAGTPQNGRFFGSKPDLDDAGPPASVAPFGAQTGADFHNTTSEYIAVANDPVFQVAEGSIQLWFKTDDANDRQTLFAKDRGGAGSGQLKIWLDDRDLKVKLDTGGSTRTIDTDDTAFDNPIRSNKWYQLTFTFGPGGMKLSLDGTLVGSNSYTGGLTGNAQPIVIGGSNASNQNDCGDLSGIRITDPFDGYIDEVAFFGTALTADQILQSRQRGAMGVGEGTLISAGNAVLAETQLAPAPGKPNTLPQPGSVTIDWTRHAAPDSTTLHRAARWAADFVSDLSCSDSERNPNDKLRLKLPAKLAAVLSKRV